MVLKVVTWLLLSFQLQGNGSTWIESIEICSLRGDSGEIVTLSEHPLSIDDSSIGDKLSKETFGGVKVQLLNSKNIMIVDTEGKNEFYLCLEMV